MIDFKQGDIIKIEGYRQQKFVIVSKNSFIKATGFFHVCPVFKDIPDGPVHIVVKGKGKTVGTVICEQIKAIDPNARKCRREDFLYYEDIMNVSDAIQCIFEYD